MPLTQLHGGSALIRQVSYTTVLHFVFLFSRFSTLLAVTRIQAILPLKVSLFHSLYCCVRHNPFFPSSSSSKTQTPRNLPHAYQNRYVTVYGVPQYCYLLTCPLSFTSDQPRSLAWTMLFLVRSTVFFFLDLLGDISDSEGSTGLKAIVIHQKHPKVYILSSIMERGNFSAMAAFAFDTDNFGVILCARWTRIPYLKVIEYYLFQFSYFINLWLLVWAFKLIMQEFERTNYERKALRKAIRDPRMGELVVRNVDRAQHIDIFVLKSVWSCSDKCCESFYVIFYVIPMMFHAPLFFRTRTRMSYNFYSTSQLFCGSENTVRSIGKIASSVDDLYSQIFHNCTKSMGIISDISKFPKYNGLFWVNPSLRVILGHNSVFYRYKTP